MNRYVFKQALKITMPVFFGYIAIGIGFGFLITSSGYAWWIAVVASLIMFTGSGQYFIVGQLVGGSSLAEIILVQFLLSIRHIFYGLALISKYKNAGIKKLYLIFAITDETFALVQGIQVPPRVNKISFYLIVSALDQFYWCFGTFIGAIAFTIMQKYGLDKYLIGIDFALTSLFLVLLIEQLKSSKDLMPALIASVVTLLVVVLYRFGLLGTSNIIWISICTSLGILLLLRGKTFFEKEKSLESNLLGEKPE